MRLLIDTNGVRFRVSASPRPTPDYKDKTAQRRTPDGQPIWTVKLTALDTARETSETLWVEVAGEQPSVTLDEIAEVHGLVFVPWVGKDGKIKRSFRAESIGTAGSKSSPRAAA
jgi:hypothetical protein